MSTLVHTPLQQMSRD